MIAVDSSALLAILLDEQEADVFMEAMLDSVPAITTPILVEMRTVITRRKIVAGFAQLDQLLAQTKTAIMPFDSAMADLAGAAFARFGKGQHRAKLNFGDCMSYAFAKSLDAPLLYKGNDFAQTDIRSALP